VEDHRVELHRRRQARPLGDDPHLGVGRRLPGRHPELRDIEGRRKVKIELPYVDGQTTDDLGRKGATFELEIVMYGPLYQNGLIDFMTEINRPEPGTLLHPVRGAVRCGLDEIVSVHSHDYRHCVRMQVRFVEHNFQVSKFGTRFRNKGIANALAGAVVAVQAVGTAIQAVRGAVGSSRPCAAPSRTR
jgi:prophage DNA circulation protein